MRVQFWGAARTVTGSMHLLEVNGYRVLLDCGLYQGKRKQAYHINRDLPFDAAQVDAVVLSHAHIDHSGNLPSLVRAGFAGPIWSTSATRDLCAHMLLDSAFIQEHDVKYVNKRRLRQGKNPFTPLYTQQDAKDTLRQFHTADYDRAFEVVPGVRVTFRDAGHILGAAIVVLDIAEDGRQVRLLFSGDIGRTGMAILRDPDVAPDVDYLIMESTYGNRYHESSGEAKAMLHQILADTCLECGSKLLIPSFALGRTQEIVYRLNEMWEDGELPPIDVYVNSPLAVNLTEVFRIHPECYDDEMMRMLMTDSDHDPLGFDRLTYVRSVEQSKMLNRLVGPAVIISASGMCEGGRILHHLSSYIGDPDNTVLFVGYQAEHTLGRRILEGADRVKIFGQEHEVKAAIRRVEGYSAHADRNELLDWAARVRDQGHVRRTFLVHGEEEGMAALADGLREAGLDQVTMPERGNAFEL